MARSDIGTSLPSSHSASQAPRCAAQSVVSSQTLVAFQSAGMMSVR